MCVKWKKSLKTYKELLSTYRHIVLPIFLITAPILCGLSLIYRANKTGRKRNLSGSAFRDPEFSGFSLVKCPSPYLQNISSVQNQYCILPVDMANGARMARTILNEVLDPCDVIIASYPKSGTTWVSEAVYLMVTNLNWNEAKSNNLEERVPYMEYLWPGPGAISRKRSPRIIKTHLPFDHLPKSVQYGQAARIIYITRDPRDTVISYYHFARSFLPAGYRNKEGLAGFVNRFLDDRLPYSPWSHHVNSYVKAAAFYSTHKADQPNRSCQSQISPKVLIITYEMLKSDMESVLRKIEQFLHDTWTIRPGTSVCLPPPRLTPDEMTQLCTHCSFDAMSQNPMTNFAWMKQMGLWADQSKTLFMRQGCVGNHRQWLELEQCDQIVQKVHQAGLDWTLKN